jgi:hypothetical protein
MRNWLWAFLLFSVPPLVAKEQKLGGYVLDPAAFQQIHSYCIDTHNLPPREKRIIGQFTVRESRPTGLLSKLPWHRVATCREGSPDAIVRPEFPPDRLSELFTRRQINGVLLVFRSGSPSPIYETRKVSIVDPYQATGDAFDLQILEHDALYFAVRMLIQDLQKLPEGLRAATS